MGGPVLSTRTDRWTKDAFDEVAARRGMRRGELLHHLIDRVLAGEGFLTADQVAERRAARADRTTRDAFRAALQHPELTLDAARYPTFGDDTP